MAVLELLFATLVGGASACRWAVYAGTSHDLASSLLITPRHALCHQSFQAPHFVDDASKSLFFNEQLYHARNHRINKDGWGLGWYSSHSRQAKRYRDPEGATDENNITNPDLTMSIAIRSQVMFAHVRAGTSGAPSPSNSHPFKFRRILWMHNGGLPREAEKKLEELIACSEARAVVRGSTDSEHLGGYFVNNLSNGICSQDTFTLQNIQQSMRNTIAAVEDLEGATHASSLNLAVSDGKHVVVTRYRTARNEDPPGLYYSRTRGAVWIASEPLDGQLRGIYNGEARTWISLVKDEMLSYTVETDTLHLECLSEACELDRKHRSESSTGSVAESGVKNDL